MKWKPLLWFFCAVALVATACDAKDAPETTPPYTGESEHWKAVYQPGKDKTFQLELLYRGQGEVKQVTADPDSHCCGSVFSERVASTGNNRFVHDTGHVMDGVAFDDRIRLQVKRDGRTEILELTGRR